MSKYNSRKMEVNGIVFDSQKEGNYYCQLLMLERAGVVTDIRLQVPFVLQPKYTKNDGTKCRAITYRADFVVDYADGHTEVVDVKGFRTKEYILKRKMLEYKYPDIKFVEV